MRDPIEIEQIEKIERVSLGRRTPMQRTKARRNRLQIFRILTTQARHHTLGDEPERCAVQLNARMLDLYETVW